MDAETIKTSEAIYYVVVWLVGAAAGISRTLRDDSINTCRNFIGIGCCSGFLGFAVVGFYDWTRGLDGMSVWGGLATAAISGLAGKEQDSIIRLVWRAAFTKFGGKYIDPTDEKKPLT